MLRLGSYTRSDLLTAIVLPATYALLAKLLLLLFGSDEIVGFLWIAGGPAVAAVLIGGPRLLPTVFVGALLGFLVLGVPFGAGVGGALRHAAVIGAATWIVARRGRLNPGLATLADFLWMLALALIVGLATASVVAIQDWLGLPYPGGFTFQQRLAGTALGIVVVTPTILVWRQLPQHWAGRAAGLEAALILGLSFLVGQVVFLDWLHDSLGLIARGYWMFLFVTWAAVRLGPHGAVLIITTAAVQGLIGAQHGAGFFSNDIARTHLANYFFYMLILATVGMAVATYFTQKRIALTELRKYQGHLEDLVGERTVRIETLNAELRQRVDEAVAANRSKSEFLAKMSHEIRTPINGVLGMAYLLGQTTLTPRQRHQLENITLSGTHLLAIINDILDIAKVEAGKLAIVQREFSVADLVGPVLAVTADSIRAKGLALHLELADLPSRLVGDCSRIGQILINYLSNAAKFTDRGAITLGARIEKEGESDVHLRFEVADTGIGISVEQQRRLFVAFEQGDNSTTRAHGGTGLGLAINKRLAELMGGEVGVDSELGRGSRFWVTMRLGKPPPAAAGADTSRGVPAGHTLRERCAGVRVLLAEDDVINQEVALGLLRSVGLVADLAADGAEAVAMAATGAYAAILMDMQMPGLDGVEATRRLRLQPACRDVPVIALTANAYADDRERCLAAGMSDFVAKPIDPAHLFAVLGKWLPGLAAREGPAVAPKPPAASGGTADCAALARIDGLDVEAGLRSVRNHLPQYLRLLRLFVEMHGGAAGQIRRALTAGRFELARRAAHTLKGAAGAIGAQTVKARAEAVESPLKNGLSTDGRAIDVAVGELEEQLERFVAAVNAIDDAGPGTDSSETAVAARTPIPG